MSDLLNCNTLYFTLKMCEMCASLGLTEIKSGREEDMSKFYSPLH